MHQTPSTPPVDDPDACPKVRTTTKFVSMSSDGQPTTSTSVAGEEIAYDVIVVKVEGVVHRVLRGILETYSQMFKDMFSLPPGPDAEGRSASNPIVLSGCTNAEFTSLMDILNVPRFKPLTLTKEKWLGVLKLATVWDMPEIREFAIKSISPWLEPLGKVRYGKEFRVKEWFLDGCIALTRPGQRQPVALLANGLGWEITAKILDACQRVSEKTRLSPIEVPSPAFRCDNCLRTGYRFQNGDAIHELSRQLQRHELVLSALPIPGQWDQEWTCGKCRVSGNQLPNAARLTIDMSGFVALAAEDGTEIVREVFKRELDELET